MDKSNNDHFDVFAKVTRERRSIRSFKKQPVPQAVLEEIFSLAQLAPSGCNTQPWLTYVVSGAARDRLSEGLIAVAREQRRSVDIPHTNPYHGVFKDRQYDAARQVYGVLGIPREDKAGRFDAFLRNYDFFGAPHVAIVCLPAWGGIREAADLGMYAQTLMLAITAHGLGSCPQAALGTFSDVIREQLDIPADHKVLFGVSFGYPDDAPVNAVRISRATLAESTRFVS